MEAYIKINIYYGFLREISTESSSEISSESSSESSSENIYYGVLRSLVHDSG